MGVTALYRIGSKNNHFVYSTGKVFYHREAISCFFFFHVTKAICFNPSGIKQHRGELQLLSSVH